MLRHGGILGGLILALACTPHERAQEPSSPCPVGMALIAGDRSDTTAGQRVCVDITEVTTAAYGACVRAGACTPAVVGAGEGEGCNLTRADRADHPINCTTWAQAQSFCGWLGKRLPDDEEWLRAVRGPKLSDPYPWGSAPPDPTRACWDRKALGTCPVGGAVAGASPAALLDLIGNVGEWTRGRSTGPGGRGRLRGGSWQDSVYTQPIDERYADSARDEPTEAATLTSGLRCVVAPLTLAALPCIDHTRSLEHPLHRPCSCSSGRLSSIPSPSTSPPTTRPAQPNRHSLLNAPDPSPNAARPVVACRSRACPSLTSAPPYRSSPRRACASSSTPSSSSSPPPSPRTRTSSYSLAPRRPPSRAC